MSQGGAEHQADDLADDEGRPGFGLPPPGSPSAAPSGYPSPPGVPPSGYGYQPYGHSPYGSTPYGNPPPGPPPGGGYPPGGYPAGPYVPGGYPFPPGYMGSPGTSAFAVASLVIGIVSLLFCGLGSILAVVFGHIGLARTSRPQAPESGRGMAIAGLVLGYIGLVVLVGFIGLRVASDSDSGSDVDPDRDFDVPATEVPDSDLTIPTSTTSADSGPDGPSDAPRRRPVPAPPPAAMAPDRLVVETIIEGTGAPAATGDTLFVHYVGVLAEGPPFDSSWDRNQMFTFTLGQGEVIAGWDEGLVGVREGERVRLVVGANKAYGAAGQPPDIPADAPLAFVVDVLEIEPAAGTR
jgi:FKBP-type peptidyl-prolyl cis-trans isomerase/Domain of unknown function (DUF4190)